MVSNRSGQALLELLISGGCVVLLMTGAGWVLKGAWERGRCAYLVFETTRSRLSDDLRLPLPVPLRLARGPDVKIEESHFSIIGEGRCGQFVKTTERVGFRKLEAMKEWR